jgi:protein-tyrosine phosphatase
MEEKETPGQRVPLEGAFNFRDIGGYETSDGRKVKKGHIYRSDSLATLTLKDHETLQKIGLRLVVDLRAPAEVEQAPDKLPDDNPPEYMNLPVSREDFDTVAALTRLKKGDTSWFSDTFMTDGYIQNIDLFSDTWGTIFTRMAEESGRPAVFHCTAGKDRTGILAALILLALGVPEETIIYDHGLSNDYIKEKLGKIYEYLRSLGVDPESISDYFNAPRDAMEATLEHLRSTYGSVEDYLLHHAGVNADLLNALKADLLE